MTNTTILTIAVAAVLITSLIVFSPFQEASSGAGVTTERDNTTVTGLETPKTTSSKVGAIVLLDNFGIGGTSDVEVTWTAPFSDSDCRLVFVGGASSAPGGPGPNGFGTIIGNDGVLTGLGTSVAHNDITGVDAILLVDNTVGGGACMLGKDFVTISTVGST